MSESKLVGNLRKELAKAYSQISDLGYDLDKRDEEIDELESKNEEIRDGELPYLTVNDQLKVDQLKEHWEKIQLSDIDEMISKL